MTWRSRYRTMVLALAVAIASAACAPLTQSGRQSLPIYSIEADSGLPTDILENWATYADLYGTFEVLKEEELPEDPRSLSTRDGEGTLNRRLTARVLDVFWTRDGAPARPTVDIAFIETGWLLKNFQKKARYVSNHGVWYEVGSTYVGPLAFLGAQGSEGPRWGPLHSTQVLSIGPDGKTKRLPNQARIPEYYGSVVTEGMTPQEVGAMLSKIPPDPATLPFQHLDPVNRYRASIGLPLVP